MWGTIYNTVYCPIYPVSSPKIKNILYFLCVVGQKALDTNFALYIITFYIAIFPPKPPALNIGYRAIEKVTAGGWMQCSDSVFLRELGAHPHTQ